MGGGRFKTQTDDNGAWVGVSSDCEANCDTGRDVAQEFIIDDGADHVHIGLDEDGDTVFEVRK